MGEPIEIRVPDIGDFDDVEVVEILVAKGDAVEVDDPIVSVESDKATMEIPAPIAGTVADLRVSEGDRVSEGTVLLVLDSAGESAAEGADEPPPPSPVEAERATVSPVEPEPEPESIAVPQADVAAAAAERDERPIGRRVVSVESSSPVPDRAGVPHASPLVRRFARELGVPVEQTDGTGPHGRVLIDDLKRTVRDRFAGGGAERPDEGQGGAAIPPVPAVDFSAFGPTREEPLTRIQKVSGPGLHRSWLNVPHVTQYDEADVTELERFRRERKAAAAERGLKLSPLLFVMKAIVVALREHPTFRSSLAPAGDHLIIKDFFHLGIAVDTEQGLVVPVIRDVDRKGVFELAEEIGETAERARNRKLGPDDLKGACFTISSLGGIGGTAFSPIVNAPEVAILGLSKTRVQPVWQGDSPLDWVPPGGDSVAPPATGEGAEAGGHFEPRMILPFSLSYDHRVIDGAEAARFTSRLSRLIADPGHLLL